LRVDQRRLWGGDHILLGVEIIAKGIVVCNSNVHARSDVNIRIFIKADAIGINEYQSFWLKIYQFHFAKTTSQLHGKYIVGYLKDAINFGRTIISIVKYISKVEPYNRHIFDVFQVFFIFISGIGLYHGAVHQLSFFKELDKYAVIAYIPDSHLIALF